jgi:hypothetical protein
MEKYSLDLEWNIGPCHPTSLMEIIIVFFTNKIVALRWCIQVNYNYYTFTSTMNIL